MHYTASDFRKSMPEWKKKRDPFIVRILHRPLSFYVAAFCANLNIQANSVSNFSTVIAVFTCLLIAIPDYVSGIVGSILLNIWLLLDCVDGNLARQVKKQNYGEFLDAVSSYLLLGFLFLSLGVRSFFRGRLFLMAGEVYILLGALASICCILMSLLYLKYVLVSKDLGLNEKLSHDGSNSSDLMKLKTAIDLNMGIAGVLSLLVFIVCVLDVCEVVVIIWFFYNSIEFIATTIYFLYKAKRRY